MDIVAAAAPSPASDHSLLSSFASSAISSTTAIFSIASEDSNVLIDNTSHSYPTKDPDFHFKRFHNNPALASTVSKPRPKLQITSKSSQGPQRLRSLPIDTLASLYDDDDDEDSDMSVGLAPDSPPDLSSSRSSTKSPSLPSSSIAAGDELDDISHFEDIALTDNHKPAPADARRNQQNSRPSLRPSQTSPSPSRPHSSSSSPNLRDLNNGLRATATLNNHARALNKSRSPPSSGRRGNGPHSSLSPPMWPPRRASSPGRRLSPSSSSTPSLSPARYLPENLPIFPLKRAYTSGPRKTAKELEQEYDDLDDELPDDAIITNVPLSPRPPHQRSDSGSPERPQAYTRRSHGLTLESRTKSWDAALHDLSIDIQDLTAKLEDHHDESQDAPLSSSRAVPRRPSLPKQMRSSSKTLPPVQRGDPLVDPLPASKEKEKHLTRTRPSWLPPKCPKEERKHLKEYQQMMSRFNEAEKRKSQEALEQNQQAAKQQYNALEVWQHHVLASWDSAMANPRTRELWWRGVPAALRGAAWARAIGNDLHLSPTSFHAALARAKATEARLANSSTPQRRQAEEPDEEQEEDRADDRFRRSAAALDADVQSAFPSARLFQPRERLHTPLREMLLAYAAYRSDTGHVRGTAAIAALVLAHVPQPEDAFVVFANLLNRPHSLAFCINDVAAKDRVYRQIARALKYKLPRLHEHFEQLRAEQGLSDAECFEPLCKALCATHLELEGAARLCDVAVFEGDAAVVRGVVAVLGKLEGKLYGARAEIGQVLGWDAAERGFRLDVTPEEWMGWVKWAGRQEDPRP